MITEWIPRADRVNAPVRPHAMPMRISPIQRHEPATDIPAETGRPPQWPADWLSAAGVEVALSAAVGHRVDTDWIKDYLRRAAFIIARDVQRPVESIDVRIIDDAEMVNLHRRHTGEAQTTDVLSFDLSDDSDHPAIQADIVICADVAARQAAQRGHRLERELLLYALHGLLHCAGFDDHTQVEYARMHAAEDRILEAIGVGATFGAQAAPSDNNGGASP